MKLILHIGMPKAGSTALQKGLAKLRPRLLEQDYFYPVGPFKRYNHSFLVAAGMLPRNFPPNMRALYKNDRQKAVRDLGAWINDIKTRIEQHQPKVLLMSGEPLFKMTEPGQFKKLSTVLRGLACEIEVVAYLRKPSDFYISSAQQRLKVSHSIKPIEAIAYRKPLEGFASIANTMHVIKYDRALFPGGDLLRHFMETFCEGVIPGEDLPKLESNVSLSAEGMALLADYRRRFYAGKPSGSIEAASLLKRAINQADSELPENTRPRLKPEFARIMNEGSTDLLWLREAYGIVFGGIDYERIAPMPAHPRLKRVEQICVVDREKKKTTALQVFHYFTGEMMLAGEAKASSSKRRKTRMAKRSLRQVG